MVNLILVRRILNAGSDDLGQTVPGTNRSFVQTSYFENGTMGFGYQDFLITCAHEIGHQLGLSTHTLLDPNSPKKHDQGLFPKYDYYLDGGPVAEADRTKTPEADLHRRLLQALMTQGSSAGQWKWIRHEDWEVANDKASKLEGSQ
jgi:hypothetical protein